MLGREPRETIEVVRPMRDGVTSTTWRPLVEMLRYFTQQELWPVLIAS
ncbi:MAG: hypothetical protein R2848_10340 [Thermomicrobiales bacterium]